MDKQNSLETYLKKFGHNNEEIMIYLLQNLKIMVKT